MSDPVYQSIFYKFNQLGPILQAGMNTHIRDDHLRMCMLQGVSSFIDGVYEHCTWKDELTEGQIRPEEFDVMLDHFIEAGEKFFKNGVSIAFNAAVDGLSLVGGAAQVLAGVATIETPLGWLLLYQGVGNVGGGLSSLINLAAGTHYNWNVTKRLDEIILGKKIGTYTFDILDLGASFRGMLRLEVAKNDFAEPIFKLFRRGAQDYVKGFKNMSRDALKAEMAYDLNGGYTLYSDTEAKK